MADVPGMSVRYVKAAMAALGHGAPHVRDPHLPLTADELVRVAKRLAHCDRVMADARFARFPPYV